MSIDVWRIEGAWADRDAIKETLDKEVTDGSAPHKTYFERASEVWFDYDFRKRFVSRMKVISERVEREGT